MNRKTCILYQLETCYTPNPRGWGTRQPLDVYRKLRGFRMVDYRSTTNLLNDYCQLILYKTYNVLNF